MENFLNVHKGEQNMHKILLSHSLLYYINEKAKITYRNPSQIIKKPRNKNKQTNKRNTNCTRVEILDWYLRLVLCVISKIQGFWLKNYRLDVKHQTNQPINMAKIWSWDTSRKIPVLLYQ